MGTTYALDGITFLFGNRDSLGTRRQGNIIVAILSQELEELVGMGGDKLSQLGVASAELLQDRLQHLGLLLNNLSELLELSVVSEEVEVAQITTAALATSGGRGSGRSSSSSSLVVPATSS